LGVAGVVFACAALVLTGWRVGVSASAGFRVAALLALAILPLGFRLTRDTELPAGTRAVVSALVGYPIAAAAYYLLARLGTPWLFPLLILALLVEAAIRALRARRAAGARSVVGVNGPVVALWAAIVLAGFSDRRPFVEAPEGIVYRLLHRDDLIHQAFYWELLRDIPPRELPNLAGMTFPPYHILPYMMGVLLARYGRLDLPIIHHAVVPVLHVTLFFAAVYLALRVRTRSARIAAGSLILLFFTSKVLARLSHWSVTTFDLFPLSESVSGGLAVWATVFCLLALSEADGRGRERFLWLSAVVAGLAVFFKAQLFALLGPAYGLGLLLVAGARRSRRMLGAALLAGATAGLVFASWRAPTRYGEVAFEPARLARERGYTKVFQALPLRHRAAAGTVLAWWDLANFPVIVPLYLAWRARRLRTMNAADAVLAFALGGSFALVAGVTVSENYGGRSTLAAVQAMESFWPWLTVGEAALLGMWLKRRSAQGERWFVVGALALALAFGPSLLRRELGRLNLTAGEAGALAFLRERTPSGSVVAHARDGLEEGEFFNRYPVVCGLAGRRAVLEYYAWQADPESNRRRALRNLFTTTDEEQARKILNRYRVNYVLEYPGLPLKLESGMLRLVYDGGDVRLHEVTGNETPRLR
jgi:hypothetical protein